MALALPVFAAVGVGLALGGRLGNLASLELRAPWLFLAVICLQLVAFPLPLVIPPWYAWEPSHPFDLVFIDGPTGRLGRSGILRVLPRLIHRDTVIVIDDTHRRAESRLAEEIAIRCGMRVEARKKRVFGVSRGFSILSPEPGP